jgi:phage FluMu gp28-like protein
MTKSGIHSPGYWLPYQAALIDDRSKHVLIEKGRRTGFTYALSYKAVEDCVEQCEKKRPKTDWWISSADETAVKEFIEYVAFWLHEAFNKVAASIGEEKLRVEDRDIQVQVVRFPNGAKITALSSNPKALRSKGGNVVLDEFAFHEHAREMWAAAPPVTRWGGQFICLSTHNGDGTIFHGQCRRAEAEQDRRLPADRFWSYHFCSLDKAIGQGLVEKVLRLNRAATPEEKAAFRQQCRDECLTQEDFEQEYCCIASSASSALLSYELIDACMDEGADMEWNPLRARCGPVFAGTDIGRTHDLTDTWLLEKIGDVLWTRANQVLRNVRFRVQFETISGLLIVSAVARHLIDGFGIGMQIAEDLQKRFGELRVQSVQVSTTNLVLMATRVLAGFEDRTVRIPRDPALREALHRPRKIVGLAGTTTIMLARDAKGHCDEFIALGLAALAAHEGGECGPVREESCGYVPALASLVGAARTEGGFLW